MRLLIPAFFDDFVLVVFAATPEELIPKCARVLENTRKAFASRGMEVNDSDGKTKVLLKFNGRGVAKSKRCHCNRNPEDCHRTPRLRLPSHWDHSTVQTFGLPERRPT